MSGFNHDHTPHVYVVCWPEQEILKVGISRNIRWSAWRVRGVVEIATVDTCCEPHSRRLEQWSHRELARTLPRAFATRADSIDVLGSGGVGYSECYRFDSSERLGETLDGPYDYERGYGLVLPAGVMEALKRWNAAFHPVVGYDVPPGEPFSGSHVRSVS